MEQHNGEFNDNRSKRVLYPRMNGKSGLASSSSSRKRIKIVATPSEEKRIELPWDVLDIICGKLDIDDLFQFAGVCKSWHTYHNIFWRAFMECEVPLVVQISSYTKRVFSFVNLSNNKIYQSKVDNFSGLSYCGFSSGYLIMIGYRTIVLMNPFTRRKKLINTYISLLSKMRHFTFMPLLTFVQGSDEFFLLIWCKRNNILHVYQSRDDNWYHSVRFPARIVDFVVFENRIFVLTSRARIGELYCDNFLKMEFLAPKNAPNNVNYIFLKLVKSEMGLLVLHFVPWVNIFDVYKIDLSTFEYVKLQTLGDVALFFAPRTECYALSNPSKWGYESNCIYYINGLSHVRKYSWENHHFIVTHEAGRFQASPRSKLYWMNWLVRNQRDEVKYPIGG